jgi:PelA/Pel-15E family pectate lyase
MKKATAAIDQKLGNNGLYVWQYLPDNSRRWGEMEAFSTMGWVQDPGTCAMGHIFLDLYHATKDEFYYALAEKTAKALIAGQLECGGWHYFINTAGEENTMQWYNTIGKQGWRMEEFLHYSGNATYDDKVTGQAAEFLLRMYVEKKDPLYLAPLKKVIDFVLQSQYKSGGWPQRYPLKYDHIFKGLPDYTSYITLNDDVCMANIEFLIHCYQTKIITTDIREPITRAMNLMLALQNGAPAPGWSDQYFVETLKPAQARSYEPLGINTATTVDMLNTMMEYYELTGETKYLARIPETMDWLESLAVSDELIAVSGRAKRDNLIIAPKYLDPLTGKVSYIHRRGSNIANGRYFFNDDPKNTVTHIASFGYIDIQQLRAEFERLKSLKHENIVKNSKLLSETEMELKTYYSSSRQRWGEMDHEIRKLLSDMNKDGFWITSLPFTTNIYKPIPEAMRNETSEETQYETTRCGDEYDTSAYPPKETLLGVSTSVYISNMVKMIEYLEKAK